MYMLHVRLGYRFYVWGINVTFGVSILRLGYRFYHCFYDSIIIFWKFSESVVYFVLFFFLIFLLHSFLVVF